MPKTCQRCHTSIPNEQDRRYHPGFDLKSIPGFEGIAATAIAPYECICKRCEGILDADISRIMQDARWRRDLASPND